VVQLPIPSHDISLRGPLVAPGRFSVALEVDGVVTEAQSFDVRADPALPYTAKDHKARGAFVDEVMDMQTIIDGLAKDLTTRRAASSGESATQLQAIEQRLIGGAAGGRGGRGGGGGPQAIRQRLSGLLGTYNISGAQTGTMAPPTVAMRTILAETKRDLAALRKELQALL